MKNTILTSTLVTALSLSSLSFATPIKKANETHLEQNSGKSVQNKASSVTTKKKPNKFVPPKRFVPPYPWGIGVGAIFSPNPYLDTSSNILPIPVITYTGKDLTFAGPYINYRFFRKGIAVTSVQAFLYPARFKDSDSSNAQIKQLNNRNFTVMAALNKNS